MTSLLKYLHVKHTVMATEMGLKTGTGVESESESETEMTTDEDKYSAVSETPTMYASVSRIGDAIVCDDVYWTESDAEDRIEEKYDDYNDECPWVYNKSRIPRPRPAGEDYTIVNVTGVDAPELARYVHVSVTCSAPGRRLKDSIVQVTAYTSLGELQPSFIRYMQGKTSRVSPDKKQLDYIVCCTKNFNVYNNENEAVPFVMEALHSFVDKYM